jgi:predicted metal-dependent TIM-barrel fold hydrolase
MMLQDVLDLNLKHKEKVTKITEEINKDNEKFKELMELFRSGNDVTKGTCAEVMKFVSQQTPEVFPQYLEELIEYINYKAPRVKWGIPEAIGYLARTYPDKVAKAVPKLLENTKNKSTVVRWCAAFGLSNIAEYNVKLQDSLLEKFKQIIEIEKNNGVKNVYLKILNKLKK